MYAFDAATGKMLWKTRLPTTAQGDQPDTKDA